LNCKNKPELRERLAAEYVLGTLRGRARDRMRRWLREEQVARLEQALEAWNADLPALKEFILPGGSRAAAAAHLARTTCRRAERSVVVLARAETAGVTSEARRYLNRLSDLLFVAGRVLNRHAGRGDVQWRHERKSKK